MKIGIVCYPTFGGSGVVATELGKGLAEKGHKVHFITYSQPARLDFFSENLFYHEVRFPNYPLFQYPPYETALTSKLIDAVKYDKLDLIHVHYAIPHASAAILAREILQNEGFNVPVITTLHGTDINLVGKDHSFKPVVEWSINNSDGVTAVSDSLRHNTMEEFKINRTIEVIPNFVDFRRFNHQPRDHFRKAIAPNNEKIVVHTSNFRKVKRVEDVVLIFAEIRKEIPSRLLLVGDGPERGNIEDLCRSLPYCDDIRFLGKQEAVEEVLSVADLFLMPSESESFGLAALEAMACGVPVVSSNVGGIPELNIEGETGFLADIGDVKKMAKGAIKLLKDEKLLIKFKQNALHRAQEFNITEILPRYERYYQEVIDSQKATGKKVVSIG